MTKEKIEERRSAGAEAAQKTYKKYVKPISEAFRILYK
ncbi:Uncharacterised protein [uncultured archaeon]|nr:Uncharacterised protein [uncultured archaeon]